MKLPIIEKNKNEYYLIHKNFSTINRYKQAFSKDKRNSSNFTIYKNITKVQSTNDISKMTLSPKLNNLHTFKKKRIIFKDLIFRNSNNISMPHTTINNNSIGFNNNKRKFISTFSISKSNNSYNNSSSLSKNINIENKSYRLLHNSSYLKKNNSEQKINLNKELKKISPIKNNIKNNEDKEEDILNIEKILTKFKINRIISNKTKNNCFYFERQNNILLDKFKNKLLNDKFIKLQIKKHRNFIFGNSEDPINYLNKYILNFEKSNDYNYHYNKNLLTKEVVESLTKKEINIILSDLFYFKNVNKNVVNLLKNSKSSSLPNILNQEESVENKQKNKTNILKQLKIKKENNNLIEKENEKEKDKEKIKNKKILLNYGKYINRLINKDLNERIKEINKKKNKKKIEVENIESCNAKFIYINGLKNLEKDEKVEDECFKSFYLNIDKEMTKQHFIENNNRRLCKEDFFQYQKIKKINEEKEYQHIILKCLDTLKKIHSKRNDVV